MWRREDYAISAIVLARRLLGALLVRRFADGVIAAGRIVETEAYVGVKDAASHAFGGRRTARNEAMYGPPGTAYVYFTYGLYDCMNIVCAAEGVPEAVLIRALEPVTGIERMRELREGKSRAREAKGMRERDLCSGPARLCQAMGIDRRLNGVDMSAEGLHALAAGSEGAMWVADEIGRGDGTDGKAKRVRVGRSARIGIDYAKGWAEKPLRFFEVGNVHVSAGGRKAGTPKKGASRGRSEKSRARKE